MDISTQRFCHNSWNETTEMRVFSSYVCSHPTLTCLVFFLLIHCWSSGGAAQSNSHLTWPGNDTTIDRTASNTTTTTASPTMLSKNYTIRSISYERERLIRKVNGLWHTQQSLIRTLAKKCENTWKMFTKKFHLKIIKQLSYWFQRYTLGAQSSAGSVLIFDSF